MTIGKFRNGSSAGFREEAEAVLPLKLLADQVGVEPDGESELLRVVVVDTNRA